MENNIKIVFATGNLHKLQEINDMSKGSGVEFILPPVGFNPEENGTTFAQNSYIKAREAAIISGNIALADDSGLCIEALNGEPGLLSSRYDATPELRISKVLKNMSDKTNRKAKFVCVMTLVDETGKILAQESGECHGSITYAPSGVNGFGYDPIFEVDGFGVTMADMSEELKNSLSHRSLALNKILTYINSFLV